MVYFLLGSAANFSKELGELPKVHQKQGAIGAAKLVTAVIILGVVLWVVMAATAAKTVKLNIKDFCNFESLTMSS